MMICIEYDQTNLSEYHLTYDFIYFFFCTTQQPLLSQGLFIVDVS